MTFANSPARPPLTEADRALLDSARNGNVEGITQALAEGANVNAQSDNGDTGLHIAARATHLSGGHYPSTKDGVPEIELKPANHCQCFITLLEAGADASHANDGKFTPLHITSMRNLAPETLALLIVGAAQDVHDSHGTTPEAYTQHLPDQTLQTYYEMARQHPAYLPFELEQYGSDNTGLTGIRIDLAKRAAALEALAEKNGTPLPQASNTEHKGTVNLGEAIRRAQG